MDTVVVPGSVVNKIKSGNVLIVISEKFDLMTELTTTHVTRIDCNSGASIDTATANGNHVDSFVFINEMGNPKLVVVTQIDDGMGPPKVKISQGDAEMGAGMLPDMVETPGDFIKQIDVDLPSTGPGFDLEVDRKIIIAFDPTTGGSKVIMYDPLNPTSFVGVVPIDGDIKNAVKATSATMGFGPFIIVVSESINPMTMLPEIKITRIDCNTGMVVDMQTHAGSFEDQSDISLVGPP